MTCQNDRARERLAEEERELTIELPDKASAGLRLAMKELREVERDPYYEVNMGYWIVVDAKSKHCKVCLVGAIMRNVKEPLRGGDMFFPGQFPDKDKHKFWGLESLRCGEIGWGVHEYSGRPPKDPCLLPYSNCNQELREQFRADHPESRPWPTYSESKKRFCKTMDLLADFLEKKGF